MLSDRDDWHDAVRGLGLRMMRFQVPDGARLHYREHRSWGDREFAALDAAVTAARERWGVKTLMFGVHRLALPVDGGKLVSEDFGVYAEAVATLVRRYAPPGNVRVEYWEPFNELDHASFLAKLKAHGQSFADVARLYAVCSQAMKAVNPEIKVGGPAAMWPGGWETRLIFEAKGAFVDFASWHQYPTGNAATPDERLLGSVLSPKGFLAGLRRMQGVAAAAAPGRPVEFYLSEYHINYSLWKPVDVRAATSLTAVFAASVLLNLGQAGIDSAMIHDVVSRHYGLLGPISRDGLTRLIGRARASSLADRVQLRPVGWVYRWWNQLMAGNWAGCEVEGQAGTDLSGRAPLVEATAVAAPARRVVVLIHRGTTTRAVELALTGAPIYANSPFELPIRVLTVDDRGARDVRAEAPCSDGTWTWDLPPMSVSFVVFPNQDHP